jgi:hypothetical protein
MVGKERSKGVDNSCLESNDRKRKRTPKVVKVKLVSPDEARAREDLLQRLLVLINSDVALQQSLVSAIMPHIIASIMKSTVFENLLSTKIDEVEVRLSPFLSHLLHILFRMVDYYFTPFCDSM